MPMILYTFFDTYDLSGKTVALFCTSGGSGLSNTVDIGIPLLAMHSARELMGEKDQKALTELLTAYWQEK